MTTDQNGFSGSYKPEDCWFLLTELSFDKIAAGQGRARETFRKESVPGWEEAPAPGYMRLYESAMKHNCARVARDVALLAVSLAERSPAGEIVLASLARAGTPFGALLVRALRLLGRTATHYGISLIHKYGVDHSALDFILTRHDPRAFWFVDGWTGKGGISRVLARSVAEYNRSRGTSLPDKLTVLSDLAGTAGLSASTDDYLVPSSPINAPMNGLLSKTFGEHEQMNPGDFHGAFLLPHLQPFDRSGEFINGVTEELVRVLPGVHKVRAPLATPRQQAYAHRLCRDALARLLPLAGTTNEDLVKHGYCETVRAMQRRPMRELLLRDASAACNRELIALCDELGISVVECRDLEYECVGICSK